MAGETAPKFALELARAALAKAEARPQAKHLKHQYTANQLIEIERRVSAVRECKAAAGAEPTLS